MTHRLDYYSVLGITRDCHADDIKKAFKQKAKVYHPDKVKAEQANENEVDAGVLFSQIYTAYRTLSDPVLRDLYDSTVYDPTSEPKLTIEGDEMFKAFEYAQLYTHNRFVFTEVLPKLAKKYQHDFRFNSGNPCVGSAECRLLNFTDMFVPLEGKPFVACVNHFYAHVCDDTCTSSTTQCTLYADCLCKDWALKNMAQKQQDTDHMCLFNCTFIQLRDAVYVCKISGLAHVCTSSQCEYKKPVLKKVEDDPLEGGVYIITCAATSREFGEDLDPTVPETAKSKEGMLEAFNLSTRSRKLTYKDASGNDVEVLMDVPWGLNIGEEVEEETWQPQLLQYNKTQAPQARRPKRSRPKRAREDGEEDPGGTPHKKVGEIGRKRGGSLYDSGEGSEEDVYEHVELGPYQMDGGANLDFREYDEDYTNLGDYATMRGQIGDEDDIVEEFKEDEEQEFEAHMALLDYRLEKVRQTSKSVEGRKNQPAIKGKEKESDQNNNNEKEKGGGENE